VAEIDGKAVEVQVFVPHQISGEPRVRNAAAADRQPLDRIDLDVGAIDQEAVLVEAAAQRLVGRYAVGGVAGGEAQAGADAVADLRQHTEACAQAQPVHVVVDIAVRETIAVQIDTVRKARAERKIVVGRTRIADGTRCKAGDRRIAGREAVVLVAHPQIPFDLDALGPFRNRVRRRPAFAACLGQHFLLELFADFGLHRFGHVLHAHGGVLLRPGHRLCGLGFGGLDQCIGLFTGQHAGIDQRIDQVQRGLAQRVERFGFAGMRRQREHGGEGKGQDGFLHDIGPGSVGSFLWVRPAVQPVSRLVMRRRIGCGMSAGGASRKGRMSESADESAASDRSSPVLSSSTARWMLPSRASHTFTTTR
jgi:hypothetical protein